MKSKGIIKIVSLGVMVVLLASVLLISGCAKEVTPTPTPTPMPTPTPTPTEEITPEELEALPLDQVPEVGSVVVVNLAELTGPLSPTIAPMFYAEKNWFDEVNANGGIRFIDPKTKKPGRVTVDYKYADCRYDASKALTAYKRFLPSKPVTVLSCSSSYTEAIYKLCEDDKVALATYACGTGPVVYHEGSYAFATKAMYQDVFAGVLSWLAKTDPGAKFAFLTYDSAYGRGAWTPETKAWAEKLGLECTAVEYCGFAPPDVNSQLLSIQKSGAKFIWMNTTASTYAVAIKCAHDLGLKFQFGGCNEVLEPILWDLCGSIAKGAMAGYGYALPATEVDVPAIKKALALQNQNPAFAYHESCTQSTLSSMLQEKAIKNALNAKGYPITGEDVYNGFLAIKDYDAMGICGPFKGSFTEKDRRFCKSMRMVQLTQGGIWMPVTDWEKTPDMAPEAWRVTPWPK